MKRIISLLLLSLPLPALAQEGITYYVDAIEGDDAQSGRSPDQAWKSLARANELTFAPADQLLLRRGSRLGGSLRLKGSGREGSPVTVGVYGAGEAPIIDASGFVAGIQVVGFSDLEIKDLEICADGGAPIEPEARLRRQGVSITSGGVECQRIRLRGLYIHDIFAAQKGETQNQAGVGIDVSLTEGGSIRSLLIDGCRIERTAATGIQIRGGRGSGGLDDLQILNNTLTDIGGPGMNPMSVTNLLVRGNTVDRSGSTADPRMRGRGSCIWPWGSDGVLIEHNRFMHARGINDCCGAHIDFNCKNVVVQYNLSLDNEGGFVEILGNNYNCCYRYNISINDGARVKGAERQHPNGSTLRNQLDGKTIFLSSFTGNSGVRRGPFNSYIYNNTIYVNEDMHSVFNFTRCTEGALIANNIFCIAGPTLSASDEEGRNRPPASAALKNVVITNNLYLRGDTLPAGLPPQDGKPLADSIPIIGDPRFRKPGGLEAADYVPGAPELVRDRGIPIEPIPGDTVGLKLGLEVKQDILGNPIVGKPDIGAIELD